MEIKDLKRLVQLMVDSDLTELEMAEGESKIHIKRGGASMPVVTTLPASMPMAAPAAAPAAAPTGEKPAAPSNLIEIKSPMVGTFYAAPSPDSEPYVAAGASISDSTVVCIIEAMKVMNEIKAEVSGSIVEICVKNAQPVEFGQVLYRVKPL